MVNQDNNNDDGNNNNISVSNIGGTFKAKLSASIHYQGRAHMRRRMRRTGGGKQEFHEGRKRE